MLLADIKQTCSLPFSLAAIIARDWSTRHAQQLIHELIFCSVLVQQQSFRRAVVSQAWSQFCSVISQTKRIWRSGSIQQSQREWKEGQPDMLTWGECNRSANTKGKQPITADRFYIFGVRDTVRDTVWNNVDVLCTNFTPTAFLINMPRLIARWKKKGVLSGALVALVVLNHVSVHGISGGLISIKLAGNDVVFHSQVKEFITLPLRSIDSRLPWLLANFSLSPFLTFIYSKKILHEAAFLLITLAKLFTFRTGKILIQPELGKLANNLVWVWGWGGTFKGTLVATHPDLLFQSLQCFLPSGFGFFNPEGRGS